MAVPSDLRVGPCAAPAARCAVQADLVRAVRFARDLGLNRQSLYNRLARIGQLLGTGLDNP